MATVDQTDVYITGVLYNSDAYPDDPQSVFAPVDEAFRDIADLEWQFLNVNRAENRFSGGTTREQLLIFMKNVTVGGTSFLSDTQSTTLRNNLITALNTISSITFVDVEIRTTRTVDS